MMLTGGTLTAAPPVATDLKQSAEFPNVLSLGQNGRERRSSCTRSAVRGEKTIQLSKNNSSLRPDSAP
jgi:hypothetical protein